MRSCRDPGAGLAAQRAVDVRRIGDDAAAAGAALREGDERLDLRPHAAGAEVALGRVSLGLGDGDAVEPLLVGLAEADRDARHAGRDHQQVGAHLDREQGGGAVLVDHRLDAAQIAAGDLLDRDAAAAAGDDERAFARQPLDDRRLDDALGLRRRDRAPPAAVAVLHHRPAELGGERARDLLLHERADRLGRLLKRGVVAVDERLRHERDDRDADAAALQRVAERVLEHEADRALGVADRVLHRHRRHLAVGDLGAAQDEADLRAVAVRQHDVPAGGDHRRDVRRRLADRVVLVVERGVRVVEDERVAADGDDCERLRGHRGLPFSPRLCASAFTAAVKHAIGAVVTPAPIWPTPARRCAMPLLITGSTPQSTTLRASIPAAPAAKSSAGSVNAGLTPSVIARIRRLWWIASAGVPPTNLTIAGAAAIAKPPTPAVSVIAESPRSAAASAMEYPGKYNPSTRLAGAS